MKKLTKDQIIEALHYYDDTGIELANSLAFLEGLKAGMHITHSYALDSPTMAAVDNAIRGIKSAAKAISHAHQFVQR